MSEMTATRQARGRPVGHGRLTFRRVSSFVLGTGPAGTGRPGRGPAPSKFSWRGASLQLAERSICLGRTFSLHLMCDIECCQYFFSTQWHLQVCHESHANFFSPSASCTPAHL